MTTDKNAYNLPEITCGYLRLLALCGITPQIVTETLYGLMILKNLPIREIWLVTTKDGRQKIISDLLGEGTGQYFAFCDDYNIPADSIAFDTSHILVADDLPDIHQSEDNQAFANLILKTVREKTADPETVLYCSLAGGRKTMSVYFALALQFFGRPQDKLYHVLTQPPEFQNHPEFYYIPP